MLRSRIGEPFRTVLMQPHLRALGLATIVAVGVLLVLLPGPVNPLAADSSSVPKVAPVGVARFEATATSSGSRATPSAVLSSTVRPATNAGVGTVPIAAAPEPTMATIVSPAGTPAGDDSPESAVPEVFPERGSNATGRFTRGSRRTARAGTTGRRAAPGHGHGDCRVNGGIDGARAAETGRRDHDHTSASGDFTDA